ncbi:molybdopterin cofactor-binding domain-containing protein [Pseudooctadecabacter sp.]|uniref:molybdopterin cofactor-binding domain-containing protein n=1 Tax=Pseudooctadecabacter sp. TaxID=1966338 RepID=UPI0035C83889
MSEVTLRDPSQWRYVGKDMQRLDIVAKSTGTQSYGIDFEVDGMVHATVVTNPRKGGDMLSYDATEADPMAGRIRLASEPNSRAVLEASADFSGWDGPDLGPNRARGVGFALSFGVPCAQVCEVTNTDRGIQIDRVYAVANVGRIVDPINFEHHISGGVIWALGHAISAEITHTDGMTDQLNYDGFLAMRQYQAPEVIVKGLELGDHVRGIGEPPVPPASAALANAIFAATGQRIRDMPLRNHIDFV